MIKQSNKRHPHYLDDMNTTLLKDRRLIKISDIGSEVYRLRKQKGQGQIPFAYEVQVSSPTIAKLELGKASDIGINKLDRIARGLGMKLSELIASIEDPS